MQSEGSGSVETWIQNQPVSEEAIDLSVIVPAYNEERRLPPTLIEMIDYLEARAKNYEIIVVDDGSRDGTCEMVKKFERIRSRVRLIRSPNNYGKGHAVRMGVLNAKGARILFADADGASPIQELDRLERALDSGHQIAIGSRALTDKDTVVSTRWYRKYLGRMFNYCVNFILLPGIADTQCGFKLFTNQVARFLFENQRSDGFSFDVEILYLAGKAEIKIAEVPINWTNIPGSKVNLILDALKMFKDIFVFKVRHSAITPAKFQEFKCNA